MCPTILKDSELVLVDSSGKPIRKIVWVDPENPACLINPQVGKTYTCTVYLKNESEFELHNFRIVTVFPDIRFDPSYIQHLGPYQKEKIEVIWSPFTFEQITSKIKDGKFWANVLVKCTQEIV
jgi:hypothetical protein